MQNVQKLQADLSLLENAVFSYEVLVARVQNWIDDAVEEARATNSGAALAVLAQGVAAVEQCERAASATKLDTAGKLLVSNAAPKDMNRVPRCGQTGGMKACAAKRPRPGVQRCEICGKPGGL